MEKIFNINGQEVKAEDFIREGDSLFFSIKGKKYKFDLLSRENHELILDNGSRFSAFVSLANRDGDSTVMTGGREAAVSVAGKKMKKAGAHAGGLTSPMPGKIFKIIMEVGSEAKEGDVILILEAMKMEHAIRADKDGKLKKINFKVGELVQGGVTLAELE
jgi:biotin carboxyl carrier protein